MSGKMEPQGGKGGNQWDDGADHDGATYIYVAAGGRGIENIKFDYVKNGETKEGSSHGVKARGFIAMIVISHPDEYLVSVEGWFDSSNIIQGIQFKTNRKTSDLFGFKFARVHSFHLRLKTRRSSVFMVSPTLISILLELILHQRQQQLRLPHRLLLLLRNYKQKVGGASWDDGVFDGVKKILVGQGNDGIAFVMFEYGKGSQVILGNGHGGKTALGTETFELDYPSKYITSVEGNYDKVFGAEAEVVSRLTFKTNRRTSQPFGMDGSESFELKEEGYKIVGFHGKAGDVVHQIGVHVVPIITNRRLLFSFIFSLESAE